MIIPQENFKKSMDGINISKYKHTLIIWVPIVMAFYDDPIYPTPPLGQDMTQGQFLSRV